MANAFNLTAQLNLRGPSNIKAVVADIRRQIGTVNADLRFRIDPSTTRNITQLTSALRNFNSTLNTTQTTANNAARAISNLGRAVASINVKSLPQQVNSSAAAISRLNSSAATTAKTVQTASTAMEELGKQSYLAVKRFAAFSIPTAAVFALTNAIGKGVSAFTEYDKQFVKLQQVTGESAAGLQNLAKTITGLSTGFGVASADITEVASTLAQAGLSARDTERALKALALSSLAPSFDDMNETVEGSIALMRQFGISASQLEGALGSVNSVAAKFAVEASDIITAIQRTGGVFATASKGVSEGTDALNEFVAVFTSVRATTRESAETIATGLRTIFTRIQRGSTIEALKDYGVNLTDLDGKFVGAYKAVQLLSEGLSKLDPRDLKFSNIVEELGGFRQIGKVIPLIQQFAVAQEALKVAQRGQGSLALDAAKAQDSLSNKIVKVKEEFFALFKEIGRSDGFQTLVRGALDLSSALIKIADSVKGVLPALGIFAAFKGVSAVTQFSTGLFRAATAKPKADGGVIRKFATGGLVPGSGNRDSVPAMLTPGEFVMRKQAVKSVGASRLQSLNKYPTGGKVRDLSNIKPSLSKYYDTDTKLTDYYSSIDIKRDKLTKTREKYRQDADKIWTSAAIEYNRTKNLDLANSIISKATQPINAGKYKPKELDLKNKPPQVLNRIQGALAEKTVARSSKSSLNKLPNKAGADFEISPTSFIEVKNKIEPTDDNELKAKALLAYAYTSGNPSYGFKNKVLDTTKQISIILKSNNLEDYYKGGSVRKFSIGGTVQEIARNKNLSIQDALLDAVQQLGGISGVKKISGIPDGDRTLNRILRANSIKVSTDDQNKAAIDAVNRALQRRSENLRKQVEDITAKTSAGLSFGAAAMFGTPYTNAKKTISQGLKEPVDVLITGRTLDQKLAKSLDKKLSSSFDSSSSKAAKKIMISSIIKDITGGNQLGLDFDRTLAFGADKILSDPRQPKFSEFADRDKVAAALKKARLSNLGRSLVKLVQKPDIGQELLSRMFVITARPPSTVDLVQNWLASQGLPIKKFAGVGGEGVSASQIAKLKAELLPEGSSFVDDDERNISEASNRSGVKTYLYRAASSRSKRDLGGEATAKGVLFEKIITDLGGPPASSDKKSIDYPNGLGRAAQYFQGLMPTIPTDAKRTLSGPSDLLDNITNYLKVRGFNLGGMVNFARGGKASKLGPEFYALEKDSGFSSREFDALIYEARTNDFSLEEFKQFVKERAAQKRAKANLRMSPIGLLRGITPDKPAASQKQTELARSLMGDTDAKYNPKYDNARRGFSGGGTVNAMVSNGEAFVPPNLARSIGYSKLEKMNRADTNGMQGFSSGGISVFKGSGSGTSDSIGPIGLPEGSFILRQKATEALGLASGGMVRRFSTGGGTGLPIRPDVVNRNTLRIDTSAQTALQNLSKVIQDLGLTGSATAKLLQNANNVSYSDAKKAAQADLARAKAAGASIDQIIAAEQSLSQIRAAADKDVSKNKTLKDTFGGVTNRSSGEVQQQIISESNAEAEARIKQVEAKKLAAAQFEQARQESDAMAKKGGALSKEEKSAIYDRTIGQARVSEEERKKIYDRSTLNVTSRVTGINRKDLESAGIGGDDIRKYAQESMMNRKALAQMDKEYRVLRTQELQAAGKTASEAKRLVEQELVDRRAAANVAAQAKGLSGPGSGGTFREAFGGRVGLGMDAISNARNYVGAQIKDIRKDPLSIVGKSFRGISALGGGLAGEPGFMASMALGALAGQGENIFGKENGLRSSPNGSFSNAFTAAGMEAGTATLSAGLATASSLAMIPGVGPFAAALTLGVTAVSAWTNAVEAGKQAAIEYAQNLRTKGIEDASERTSKAFTEFEKDPSNLNAQKALLDSLSQEGSLRLTDSKQRYEDIAQRREFSDQVGYSDRFYSMLGYDTVGDRKTARREALTKAAESQAKSSEPLADVTNKFIDSLVRSGKSLAELGNDPRLSSWVDTIAQADKGYQLAIQSGQANIAQEVKERIQKSLLEDANRKGIAATVAAAKAMDEADRAGRDLAMSFDRMATSFNQSLSRVTFESDQRDSALSDATALYSGDARIGQVSSRDANILRNPRAYSARERDMAENRASSFFGKDRDVVKQMLGIDAQDFGQSIKQAVQNDLRSADPGKGANLSLEQASSTARKNLEAQLASAPENVREEILGKFKAIVDQIDSQQGVSTQEKVNKLINEVDSQLGNAASDAAKKVKEMAIAVLEFQNGALNKLIERTNAYADAQLKAQDYFSQARDIRTSGRDQIRAALGMEPPSAMEMKARLDSRVAALSGGPTDAASIGAKITRDSKARKTLEEEKNKLEGSTDPKDKSKLLGVIQELGRFNNSIKNGQQALELLADGGNVAAAAFERIKTIQQNMEGQGEFLDKLATASPEEALKLSNSFARLNGYLNGNINSVQNSMDAQEAFLRTLQETHDPYAAHNAGMNVMAQQRGETLALFKEMIPMLKAQGKTDVDIREMFARLRTGLYAESGMFSNPMLSGVSGQTIGFTRDMTNNPEINALLGLADSSFMDQSAARIAQGSLLLKDSADVMKTAVDNFNTATTDLQTTFSTTRAADKDRVPTTKSRGGLIYAKNGTLVDYKAKGSDTVPAMLTPGEFVVNAKSTAKNLPLLKQINDGAKGYRSGGIIYYQDGGFVPPVDPKSSLGRGQRIAKRLKWSYNAGSDASYVEAPPGLHAGTKNGGEFGITGQIPGGTYGGDTAGWEPAELGYMNLDDIKALREYQEFVINNAGKIKSQQDARKYRDDLEKQISDSVQNNDSFGFNRINKEAKERRDRIENENRSIREKLEAQFAEERKNREIDRLYRIEQIEDDSDRRYGVRKYAKTRPDPVSVQQPVSSSSIPTLSMSGIDFLVAQSEKDKLESNNSAIDEYRRLKEKQRTTGVLNRQELTRLAEIEGKQSVLMNTESGIDGQQAFGEIVGGKVIGRAIGTVVNSISTRRKAAGTAFRAVKTGSRTAAKKTGQKPSLVNFATDNIELDDMTNAAGNIPGVSIRSTSAANSTATQATMMGNTAVSAPRASLPPIRVRPRGIDKNIAEWLAEETAGAVDNAATKAAAKPVVSASSSATRKATRMPSKPLAESAGLTEDSAEKITKMYERKQAARVAAKSTKDSATKSSDAARKGSSYSSKPRSKLEEAKDIKYKPGTKIPIGRESSSGSTSKRLSFLMATLGVTGSGSIGQALGYMAEYLPKSSKNKNVKYKNLGGIIYASNGTLVPYEPKGTDTVPAMLTPGEFVVNRQATQKHLPLLQSINKSKGGSVKYLAKGGPTGDIDNTYSMSPTAYRNIQLQNSETLSLLEKQDPKIKQTFDYSQKTNNIVPGLLNKNDFGKFEQKITKGIGLASGGIVYASKGQLVNFQPKGTDTVPAMLTPGEFVVNANATKKHLPLLHSINKGQDANTNKYSSGGIVYLRRGGPADPFIDRYKGSQIQRETSLNFAPPGTWAIASEDGLFSIDDLSATRLISGFAGPFGQWVDIKDWQKSIHGRASNAAEARQVLGIAKQDPLGPDIKDFRPIPAELINQAIALQARGKVKNIKEGDDVDTLTREVEFQKKIPGISDFLVGKAFQAGSQQAKDKAKELFDKVQEAVDLNQNPNQPLIKAKKRYDYLTEAFANVNEAIRRFPGNQQNAAKTWLEGQSANIGGELDFIRDVRNELFALDPALRNLDIFKMAPMTGFSAVVPKEFNRGGVVYAGSGGVIDEQQPRTYLGDLQANLRAKGIDINIENGGVGLMKTYLGGRSSGKSPRYADRGMSNGGVVYAGSGGVIDEQQPRTYLGDLQANLRAKGIDINIENGGVGLMKTYLGGRSSGKSPRYADRGMSNGGVVYASDGTLINSKKKRRGVFGSLYGGMRMSNSDYGSLVERLKQQYASEGDGVMSRIGSHGARTMSNGGVVYLSDGNVIGDYRSYWNNKNKSMVSSTPRRPRSRDEEISDFLQSLDRERQEFTQSREKDIQKLYRGGREPDPDVVSQMMRLPDRLRPGYYKSIGHLRLVAKGDGSKGAVYASSGGAIQSYSREAWSGMSSSGNKGGWTGGYRERRNDGSMVWRGSIYDSGGTSSGYPQSVSAGGWQGGYRERRNDGSMIWRGPIYDTGDTRTMYNGGVVYASNGTLIEAKKKGTDTVPAMLTPGEFVVNRQATQKHMPVLQAINKGYYNSGGIVEYLNNGGIVAPRYYQSGSAGAVSSMAMPPGGVNISAPSWLAELDNKINQVSFGLQESLNSMYSNLNNVVNQLNIVSQQLPREMNITSSVNKNVNVNGISGEWSRYQGDILRMAGEQADDQVRQQQTELSKWSEGAIPVIG